MGIQRIACVVSRAVKREYVKIVEIRLHAPCRTRYATRMLETLPLHHLARVVSLLARGNVVAYPTGTSYGLGVNALDPAALERLSALKRRPPGKSYTILLPERDADRYVAWAPEETALCAALRDRPLTLLVRARQPLIHLAVEGRVGVRTPDHPFTREVAALLPFPITATSANRSAEEPVCQLADLEQLAAAIRLYVVDGGNLARCLPSTVAMWENGQWILTRHGEVTEAELEAALSPVQSAEIREKRGVDPPMNTEP